MKRLHTAVCAEGKKAAAKKIYESNVDENERQKHTHTNSQEQIYGYIIINKFIA